MKDEASDITPSMKQYLDIKKDYQDYLVFYRMGDFYELFYEDAVIASKALDLVLTSRTKDVNIPMCGVPYHAYESYLARLIHQGYKVAIAEQTETPEEAKKRGRNTLVNREVIRLVTPGTLTEDNLLNARLNNYLLCVVKNMNTLGFSWMDLSTGDFYTQRTDSDEGTYVTDICNMFSKIDPSEIIVSDVLLSKPAITQLFSNYTDKSTVLPENRFNFENTSEKIKKFYHIESLEAFGKFSVAEIIAAGIILDYIETTQKGQMPRIKNLVSVNDVKYMSVDASTARNLELVISTDGVKGKSLLSAVDETITGAGARLFRHRLLNPSLNVFEINNRLDCVEFFITVEDMRKDLREIFKSVADLERIVTPLSLQKKGPKDILALKKTLFLIPKIKNIISNYGRYGTLITKLPPAIENILGRFSDFSVLADFLDRALKHDDTEEEKLPAYVRDGGFVRKGFDTRLDILNNLRNDNIQVTESLAKKYSEELNIPNLKIKYNSLIGYFLEVPKKFSDTAFQNEKFVHRQTVLNAVRFTTAELSELERDINSAESRALSIELEIYEDIVTKILAESKNISAASAALAELDVACGVAELAQKGNYIRPVLDNSTCFEVRDGRHPVVEKALKKMHKETFVSNSCKLDETTNRLWLMTGPNMAGKSTFLRQNALIAILAQMGAYVPASYARIGIIDKIFSRVGASDDLSRGRSTFMVEMVETATILNQSTPKSFVILDEIGRGTATYDGLSIAWAVIEHLLEVNRCRALFATHYHELTVLADKFKQISLHAMKIKEFNGNVIFMHEVIDGVADRSYGVHVANLAGLPKLVTKRAEQILKTLEKNGENKKITAINDDLPLFRVFKDAEEEKKEQDPFADTLQNLNPDNLTPREALDKLYELKVLYASTHK